MGHSHIVHGPNGRQSCACADSDCELTKLQKIVEWNETLESEYEWGVVKQYEDFMSDELCTLLEKLREYAHRGIRE